MDRVHRLAVRIACAGALVAALGTLVVSEASAQDTSTAQAVVAAAVAPAPTYYGAVQGVLERNCVTCHTDNPVSVGGMIAPFSLTSYESARRYAARIARAVGEDYMPPWDADIQHQGQFKNERYLSPEDKQALIDWAEADAPMGDPSEAAGRVTVVADAWEPTVAPDGRVWMFGLPDMVVGFDEPINVCAEIEDWQP